MKFLVVYVTVTVGGSAPAITRQAHHAVAKGLDWTLFAFITGGAPAQHSQASSALPRGLTSLLS